MNATQAALYTGIGVLFDTFGEGGATWRRTRASGAAPGTTPTIGHTSGIALRFMPNGRIVEQPALVHMPIYDAAYWGLCPIGTDVQVADIYDNGTIAFVVSGVPDTSQGFMVIPADRTGLPS